MRDIRLSFWSAVYGCFGLLFVILSRILSAHLLANADQTVGFLNPLNYLLTFGSLVLFLRAVYAAGSATKEMRAGKSFLRFMQASLIFDLFFQIAAQVLQFTLGIQVTDSKIVLTVVTLFSVPSLIGVFSLYFYKQLRGIGRHFLFGLFVVSVIRVILRIGEQILLPLCADHAVLSDNLQSGLEKICSINDELSFIIYVISLAGLIVYAYYIGKAAKKMPEKAE